MAAWREIYSFNTMNSYRREVEPRLLHFKLGSPSFNKAIRSTATTFGYSFLKGFIPKIVNS